MLDEAVNDAIDAVARQMTETPPPAGTDFRRRVLARIESDHAPRARWRAAFVLPSIAVAAVIVLAVFVARARKDQPAQATPSVVQILPGRQIGSGIVGLEPDPAQGRGAERAAPPRATEDGHGNLRGTDREPTEVLALAPPPLTIESIDLPTIHTDAIELPPLETLAPIGVTPLASPTEGDRP